LVTDIIRRAFFGKSVKAWAPRQEAAELWVGFGHRLNVWQTALTFVSKIVMAFLRLPLMFSVAVPKAWRILRVRHYKRRVTSAFEDQYDDAQDGWSAEETRSGYRDVQSNACVFIISERYSNSAGVRKDQLRQ
jgi:hypothetical protein